MASVEQGKLIQSQPTCVTLGMPTPTLPPLHHASLDRLIQEPLQQVQEQWYHASRDMLTQEPPYFQLQEARWLVPMG